ncbi:hypothetical protein ACMFMG_009116 [Clarireedia jacksonii]
MPGKRLREAKQNRIQASNSSNVTRDQNTQIDNKPSDVSNNSSEVVSFDSSGLISSDQNLLFCSSSIRRAPSMNYELSYCPPTVFSALFTNGQILGILSCGGLLKVSPPACSDIPSTLHPTLAQSTTPIQPALIGSHFPRCATI